MHGNTLEKFLTSALKVSKIPTIFQQSLAKFAKRERVQMFHKWSVST